MLVQGISSNSRKEISEKGVELFLTNLPQKEREEYITNVVQSLVTVSRAAINSPSETEIFDYCRNVLEAVATEDEDTVTVIYFFRSVLLSRDPLLQRATLVLLHSYCTKKKFDLSIAPGLLSDVIALYREECKKNLELSANIVTLILQNLKHTDQMKLVSDVCLAVKCAVFRSKDKQFPPGLCHSKGFDAIFSMYEKVILKGIMKDKRLAVRALKQLILFSSEEAMDSSLASLANVLTRVLLLYMNAEYTFFKIAVIETLTTLIAKVGIKLKNYFRKFETTFFKLVKCDNYTLQLKSIRALCILSRFNDQMDNLYDDIAEAIIQKGDYLVKDRVVFALRCIIKCSCTPFPKDKFLVPILSLMDKLSRTRLIAAGCIGTIIGHLPDEEMLRVFILDDDQTAPWNLRQSKCTALLVALKESPGKLLQGDNTDKIFENLLSYLISDIPKLISCGLAACGYYMLHKLQVEEEINPVLLEVFCETMNYFCEDVKNAFGVTMVFLADRVTLPLPFMKAVIPQLINGTKDNSSKVRSSCEHALAAILDLYNHEEISQTYFDALDKDAQGALQGDLMHHLKIIAKKQRPKQTELEDFTRL